MEDSNAEPVTVDEIRSRVAAIQSRIQSACRRAGRAGSEVRIVAVTKTFSSTVLLRAVEAGVTDFGENRVQELTQKAAEVRGEVQGGSITWHMIGHLQRNKARDVVQAVDMFHALDSVRLATELNRRAEDGGRVLPCMIQINTSGEGSKSGISPTDVDDFVSKVRDFGFIMPRGFMTIAAPADDPEQVRHEFRALRKIRDQQAAANSMLSLDYLSMGMSQDFEVAIEEGATHVRIGSAIFGRRRA